MTTLSLSGLVAGGRIGPQILGYQGPRFVVDRSDVPKQLDKSSGLYVCPLDQIFVRSESPIIVFGTPNVALVLPNGERTGWDRFAAFMFWRQKSFVASTKGRVQAGVLFELTGPPESALDALNGATKTLVGTRKASCAHSVALALHRAGFTGSGGRSLRWVYRPSRLASILWRGGLEYQGAPVQVRIIQTRQAVADHFVSVWKREPSSIVRLYHKYIARSKHGSAPVFDSTPESIEMADDLWADDGPQVSIGIGIPSNLGVKLSFVLGEQPEFVMKLPRPLTGSALQTPLRAFAGKLDLATKTKKYVMFSRPVIWFMRRHLVNKVEWTHGVRPGAIPRMLRRSPGPARATAFAYSLVITRTEIRLKRLCNNNGRDQRFVNWMLAKHVLLSGYSPEVLLPGELWCYLNDQGELVVCISRNSGTYKPDEERFRAAVQPLSEMFGVKVEVVAI